MQAARVAGDPPGVVEVVRKLRVAVEEQMSAIDELSNMEIREGLWEAALAAEVGTLLEAKVVAATKALARVMRCARVALHVASAAMLAEAVVCCEVGWGEHAQVLVEEIHACVQDAAMSRHVGVKHAALRISRQLGTSLAIMLAKEYQLGSIGHLARYLKI